MPSAARLAAAAWAFDRTDALGEVTIGREERIGGVDNDLVVRRRGSLRCGDERDRVDVSRGSRRRSGCVRSEGGDGERDGQQDADDPWA